MTDSKPTPTRPQSEVLTLLGATFPVFRDCLPLAIGIHKAISEKLPAIAKEDLRRELKRHTASTRYLKSLAAGTTRFDLDGAPAGAVTPEQRQQAQDTLRERFKRIAERKKGEQQAQQLQENLLKLAEKFNAR